MSLGKIQSEQEETTTNTYAAALDRCSMEIQVYQCHEKQQHGFTNSCHNGNYKILLETEELTNNSSVHKKFSGL